MSDIRISVVIPTFRRAAQLVRCLDGLRAQTTPPFEVVVVRRTEDEPSRDVLAPRSDVLDIDVEEVGMVTALIAGVRATAGTVIAFTDDDAIPRADWLERIEGRFRDESVGAVGGRDIVHGANEKLRHAERVGEISRMGRLVGNHHVGSRSARDVAVLKGVNMAFRREALALPYGLRGEQDQPHWEVATSQWAQQMGWRLVYDPAIVVDHYPGPRFDEHRRVLPGPSAVRDGAYNLVASLLAARPDLATERLLYGLFLGDRSIPGIARVGVAVVRREHDVARRLVPSLVGQSQALADHVRRRRPSPITFALTPSGEHLRHRPTIALVAHDIHDRGGMERAFAELIRRGHDAARFVVVSATIDDELRESVQWRRVPSPSRPFPLKFVWFFAIAATRLRRVDADLVHTLGAIVPNRADVASVHFCHAAFAEHSDIRRDDSSLRRLNGWLTRTLSLAAERWCYRPSRLQLAAVVSQGVEEEMQRHFPGLSVSLTPNGVDTERFAPDLDSRLEVRREYSVGADEVIALFVGGDWQRKGLSIAVEGLAVAVSSGADQLRLWVVGRGDEEGARRIAERLGVAERVHFLGPREDTERFFRAVDLFVLPSLYETFSLAAHEAARCGIPVVATPVSGVVDLLRGNCGLLVERNAQAVGAAMARLAADGDLRLRMGRCAQRRVRRFTWDASVESVLDAYGSLLGAEIAGGRRA